MFIALSVLLYCALIKQIKPSRRFSLHKKFLFDFYKKQTSISVFCIREKQEFFDMHKKTIIFIDKCF